MLNFVTACVCVCVCVCVFVCVCVCVEHGLMVMARSGRIIHLKSSLSPRLLNVIKVFEG